MVPADFLLTRDDAAAARALLPRSLQYWLDAEQTRVTREVDPRRTLPGDVSAVAPPFRPEARRVFTLATRWVAPERVRVTVARAIAGAWSGRFRRRGGVLFLAHPLALAGAPTWFTRAPDGPRLFAAATASTRTALVWSADPHWPPFFAKLSLPIAIGGLVRRVDEVEAVTSVGLTGLLLPLVARDRSGLQLLPEPLSVVPRARGAPGGFVVRTIPPAVATGRRTLVPWFALTHPGRDGSPALLPGLVRGARSALLPFVRHRLLRPFLRAWLQSALAQGWCADVHGQNLLVELDRQRQLTGRFFVRDVEGVYADLGHLAACRRSTRSPIRRLPFVRSIADDYDQLQLEHGAASSLHTHFRAGPIWHLARIGRRRVGGGQATGPLPSRGEYSRLFFRELSAQLGAGGTPPPAAVVRRGEAFASWLLDQRQARQPRRRVPRALARWLELEQTTNDRVRDPRLFAPIDLSAIPQRGDPARRPVWQLEYIEIPVDRLAIAARPLPPAIERALFFERGGVRWARYFVHPLARDQHGLEVARHGLQRGEFWATPTASVRTLAVWSARDPRQRFALKLSIDVELLRIRRIVKASKLARATALTAVFDAVPRPIRRQVGFEVMREPVTLRLPEQEHGTIVRQLAPRMNRCLPGFALFADRPDGAPPLALTLAGPAVDAERLVRWLIDEVWAPLVRTAAHLMFAEGLIPDLHQQNVLFEQSRGRLSGRLLLRDLDSIKTDLDLRRQRGRTVQPFLDAAGTPADLKLEESHRLYDEAWARELRGEWVYLGERLCRRWATRLGGPPAVRAALAGRRLWAAFDRLILAAAIDHLGHPVVATELVKLLRARQLPAARAAAARLEREPPSAAGLRVALATLPDRWLVDQRALRLPLYSLNAMVHDWKRRPRA